MIRNYAGGIDWKVQNGWPREQASAFSVLSAYLPASIAAAVKERSPRYAASTHILCEAMSTAAKRLKPTDVAPLVYWNLTGRFALSKEDPAWEALLSIKDNSEAGFSFLTNGIARGNMADSNSFPDDKGYYMAVNLGGQVVMELTESDIVCFKSAPTDGDGYHSFIQTSGASYMMPPLATVTLEKVQQPGEWYACGYKVQRRCYTVSITYK